jgi:Asp/Glu/hydantoin racemase
LARYGHRTGAQAILATCSAFGPAIERADRALPIPVAKPNEAMFRAALTRGDRIGMLATFAPSAASMSAEFAELAAGTDATLDVIVVDGAIDALRRGDTATHNRLVSQRAAELDDHDAIMLAHFSTSVAAADTRANVDVPVFTAPESAVATLRDRLLRDNGGTD